MVWTNTIPQGIACLFVDTNFSWEGFFVCQVDFLGWAQTPPYKALMTTVRAEIGPEAWPHLKSEISRSFSRPASGCIAVKVTNHFVDEVMKTL